TKLGTLTPLAFTNIWKTWPDWNAPFRRFMCQMQPILFQRTAVTVSYWLLAASTSTQKVGAVFCGLFPLKSNRTPAKVLPIEFVGVAPGDNMAPGVLLNCRRPKLLLVGGLTLS